jgi:hypothetical protein
MTMGLNDQVRTHLSGGTGRKRLFADNVKVKYLSGKDPVQFKILPAFDPRNPDPRTSVLPFVLPDGQLTEWGMLFHQARYLGHGSGKTRQDFVCMQTFARNNEQLFDPIDHLCKVVGQLSADWGYLLKDIGTGPDAERAPLSRPSASFIANVWDPTQPGNGVQIGILPPSAATSLLDARLGLAFQRANIPEEYIRQNYILGYAVGDLTDPINGPVLETIKEREAQKSFSKYRVRLFQDAHGQVAHPAIGSDLLAMRYDFSRPESFICVPNEEETIAALMQLFNMRSPRGIHEYVLLRIAFPNSRIPEPPSAGTSTTIPSGFGAAPAPQTPPPAAYQPPTQPAYQPPAQPAYQAPAQPAYQPPQAPQQPVAPPQQYAPVAPPPQQAYPPQGQMPQQPPQAPQQQVYPPQGQPMPQQPPQAPQQPIQQPQAAGTGPVAPGDVNQAQFDQAEFIRKMQAKMGQQSK